MSLVCYNVIQLDLFTSLAAKISGVRLERGADFLKNGCCRKKKQGIQHNISKYNVCRNDFVD